MILELKHITFTFPGRNLLNNLSLKLNQGNIYALMGINGSGKTTLFNLITGFIKSYSGDIIFKGNNISRHPPHKINRIGIGRTFQDLRLISSLTVKENVMLAMYGNSTNNLVKALLPQSYYQNEKKALEEKAEVILSEYFLIDVIDNLAGEISYGQQKLLNLACCVANGASLLLLDEPLAGVNEEYLEVLKNKIQSIISHGKTILLIDHHTDFIDDVVENIFFLNEGQIRSFDTMEELKNDPKVIEAYLT